MRPANTVTARLYIHEDYTATIDRLKELTDHPSLTTILTSVLRLLDKDPDFAEKVIREVGSAHLDKQLKQWFAKGDGNE